MEDSSTEAVVKTTNEENLGFAFNDFGFSDRILRLEIVPCHHPDHTSEDPGEDEDSIVPSKKRRVGEPDEKFSPTHANCSLDSDSGSYDGAKVVTFCISSPILALKSPFFYKLFKNGMRESQQQNDISLRINASEEASFMDVLNFMYGNTLKATSFTDLINVLIIADKFEVTSCVMSSIRLLRKLHMSLEHAVFSLELPSSVLASQMVQPLIDRAKRRVIARYKDFNNLWRREKATKLPLSALEVVLGSNGLRVDSEDDVFDFILKWARANYPELEERREILAHCLAQFMCFPNMSSSKLKEALACLDFDHGQVSKLVTKALFSKVELSCGHHIYVSMKAATTGGHPKDLATTYCGFLGRAYSPHCVVYFDLTRDKLKGLLPLKRINSQPFCLGGKQLYLMARRSKEPEHFGLYLCKEEGTETCTIRYELAVLNKLAKEFESKFKKKSTFVELGWGQTNLLGISWTEFMSDD